MTEPSGRATKIAALLAKAEANGTTPEEREAYSAKAAELMILWGIEEAIVRGSGDRLKAEAIIKFDYMMTSVPLSYGHEYATVGYHIAEALGCRALLIRRGKMMGTTIIGFEEDVAQVKILINSLLIQCQLNLGKWYANAVRDWMSGTDKYNIKRGFISGYANGVKDKLTATFKQTVAEAGHGAEVVVIERTARIDSWVAANMSVGNGRARTYEASSRGAGFAAGQRANVGQPSVGVGRRGIEA